jgi:hypothetical protein
MHVKSRVKFPCGFEVEEEASTSVFDLFGWINKGKLEMVECPLHGKNCPPLGGK